MLYFINNLYNQLYISHKCFGLFINLSKVFDRVYHDLLLRKILEYSFCCKLNDWVKFYLASTCYSIYELQQLVDSQDLLAYYHLIFLDVKIEVLMR